jgi:hypothetical protein
VFFAEIARKDALDGKVTIYAVDYENGRVLKDTSGNPVVIGEYEVNPAILEAIKAYPEVYRSGVFGPDAYPDIATGQQVIHPAGEVTPGESDEDLNPGGPGPNPWLEHLWSLAYGDQGTDADRTTKARAFVAGYITHAAGDIYAHTLVNHYTGGAFHILQNALKHTVVEGYMNKRLPPLESWDARIDGEIEDFIFRNMTFAPVGSKLQAANLLRGDATNKSIPAIFSRWYNELDAEIKGYYRKKDRYNARIEAKLKAASDCGVFDFTCSKVGLMAQAGAIETEKLAYIALHGLPTTYKEHWRDDIRDGLKALPRLSHELARALFFNPPKPGERFGKADLDRVKALINDYVTHHLLSMLGVPDFVGLTVAQVQKIIDELVDDLGIQDIRDAIKEMKEDALNFVLEATFGTSIDDLKEYLDSPEQVFDRVMNTETFNEDQGELISLSDFNTKVLHIKDTGYSNPDDPETFDWQTFPPAYNAVTMSKLVLLSPKGINDLLHDLGSSVTFDGPDAVLGFAATLDGSNQWHVNDQKMALARDCAAYQRVFMKQVGENACDAPPVNLLPPSVTLTDGHFQDFKPYPLQQMEAEIFNRQPGDAFAIREKALFSYSAPPKVTKEATVLIKATTPDDTGRVARARVKLVDLETYNASLPIGGGGKDGSDFTWTGEGDGVTWTDPCNWVPKDACSDDSKYPGQDPDKDDSASLPGDRKPATIVVTEDIKLKNLSITPGTYLQGVKTLLVKNSLSWSGGVIGCNIRVVPSGRLTVDNDKDVHVLSRSYGGGIMTLEGDAIWFKGDIRLDIGASIINKGRFFSRVANAKLTGNCCVENNTFTNTKDGQLLVLTSPIIDVAPPPTLPIPIDEGKTIDVDVPLDPDVSIGPTLPGHMAFSGVGLINSGRIEVRENATLHVGIGNHILNDGTVFTGDGRAILAGQNTVVNGQVFLEDGSTVELATGLGLRNTATFSGAGTLEWTGGTLYAKTELAPSATLVISGAETKYLNGTVGDGLLTNNGSIEWNGANDTLRVVNSHIVNKGIFRARGRATLAGDCCVVNNTLENEQVMAFLGTEGAGESDQPTGMVMKGVGLVQKGVVELKGDALVMDYGNHVFSEGARFVGTGRARLVGGGLKMAGSVSLEPETVFEVGTMTGATGGRVNGLGGFTGEGTFRWTGGTLYGDVTVGPRAKLVIAGDADKRIERVNAQDPGLLTSQGAGMLQSGGAIVFAGDARITNKGTFTIQQDGILSALACCVAHSALRNEGSLVKESPDTTVFRGVFLDNAGTVEVKHGTLGFYGFSTYNQTDGVTRLWDTTISNATREPIAVKGGLLTGSGKIAGSLTNGGVLSPGNSVGRLTVVGTYTQSPEGTLELEVGGPTPATGHDQLQVIGDAQLAGALRVSITGGFKPSAGDQFRAVSSATLKGAFATTQAPDLDGGLTLKSESDAAGVLLVVHGGTAPIPGDLTGEGSVSVADVVLGLRMAAGLVSPTDAQAAAVDVYPVPGIGPKSGQPCGDGLLTIGDVIRLLKRTAGLETTWP